MLSHDKSKLYSYRQRVYAEYGDESYPVQVQLESREPYLRWLIKKCFPNDVNCKVLDLGCGNGALLYFLHKSGYINCLGIDISTSQVKSAKELGINVTQDDLIEALAAISNETQDVVVTLDVIEHLTKSDLLLFADEVFRVLKVGGRWVVHCPNGDSPFFAAVRYGDWTHEQAFTATSLGQIAKASGFSSINCYEDKIIPHGGKSLVRSILWRFVRLIYSLLGLIETGSRGSSIHTRNLLSVIIK